MKHTSLKTLIALLILVFPAASAAIAGGMQPALAAMTPASTPDAAAVLFLPIMRLDPPDPPASAYDMLDFLTGDGRLYEVQHSSGPQARHQTQIEGFSFFHTKGNEVHAEWEELWYDNEYIYRGTDTSPGNEMYYTLRDPGTYGSAWAPRYWSLGELFYRNPLVTFYEKSNCGVVTTGTQGSYLLFEAYYPSYQFDSGIVLNDVVQLAWLLTADGEPVERYYYAANYGLVGWASNNNGMSYISEIHAPGTRPDNTREEISCLNREPAGARQTLPGPLPYWPGNHRR